MGPDVLWYVKRILASPRALPAPQAAPCAGLRRTPADQSLSAALEELEMAAFGAVAAALKTSGIEATEVAPGKRLSCNRQISRLWSLAGTTMRVVQI